MEAKGILKKRVLLGKRDHLLLGVCDDIALQVVALHQRLVVEIGHAHVFNVSAHIKNLVNHTDVD